MKIKNENYTLSSIEGLENFVKSKNYRDNLSLGDEISETYEFLGAGEYNNNFVFIHPKTGEKLVLRVECGSQLKLDNQIEYECKVLKSLENTARVPKIYYCDASKTFIDHGVSVMQFIPGMILNYESDYDLNEAATILADIHSCKPEDTSFL